MEDQKTWKAGNNTGNERYFSQSPLSPRLARIKNRNTGAAGAAAIRKFSRPPPPLLPLPPPSSPSFSPNNRDARNERITRHKEARSKASRNNTAKNNIYYRSLGKDNGPRPRERLSLIVNSCHLRATIEFRGWLYNSGPFSRVVIINHSTTRSSGSRLLAIN